MPPISSRAPSAESARRAAPRRRVDRRRGSTIIRRMAAPHLSFVTVCKARLEHLEQTLPLLAAQPGTEAIVVDYGCPQGTRSWVRERFPGVKVVEVDDDPGFCVARARNLGAAAASAPRLCFVDADVRLREGFAA